MKFTVQFRKKLKQATKIYKQKSKYTTRNGNLWQEAGPSLSRQ